jgi:EEF1A lysine methyltransferase 2
VGLAPRSISIYTVYLAGGVYINRYLHSKNFSILKLYCRVASVILQNMEDTSTLDPSKLGTREYWDEFYDKEINNFEDNPSDCGQNWFEESGAQEKIISFLSGLCEDGELEYSASMLDLGCGNGELLLGIRNEGFEGSLTGIDYSAPAVRFADLISKEEGVPDIQVRQADFLADSSWNTSDSEWQVVLDKGTLDAIALSSTTYEQGLTGVQQYAKVVKSLIEPHGILLITSCNFTEPELDKIILQDGLSKWKIIKYPTIQFAGQTGQTVVSVAYQRSL